MAQPAITVAETVCELMDRALFKQGNRELMNLSPTKLAEKMKQFDPMLEYVPSTVLVAACRDYLEGN